MSDRWMCRSVPFFVRISRFWLSYMDQSTEVTTEKCGSHFISMQSVTMPVVGG